jgi:hypothetical protein
MNLELYWFSNFRDLLAYIKGDRRFYSFNIIDVVTHQVYIESQRSQEVPQIGGSLLRAWKVRNARLPADGLRTHVPGSYRYPRSLGLP